MASADVILFAIRAGIRLGKEARQAYIDGTRRREITLPLPDFDITPNVSTAITFFKSDGKEFIDEDPALAAIHEAITVHDNATPAQEEQYMLRYEELFTLVSAREGAASVTLRDGSQVDNEALVAWLTFRQWQRGEKGDPKSLRRIAGVLVEIGVDYFATMPGALSRDSRHGKILGSFVDALDEIPFSEILVEEGAFRVLVGRLFVAALETVAEQSELVSSDPNVRDLVKIATEGLSKDIANKLAATGSDADKDRLEDWGELVFRSLLSTAGRKVLSEPGRFLGVDRVAEGALVTSVGTSLIDLAIENDKLDLKRVFGRDGLDTLLKATLDAVGDHPELVTRTGNNGVKAILSGLATSLAGKETLLDWGILPEVGRLLLEKTGENLALLWPDLETRPEKHLLLAAATKTLEILSAPPAQGDKWTLRFGRDDILAVLETTLDDFAANPQWVIDAASDESKTLGKVIEEMVKVLRERGDRHLGKELALDILAAGVQATALRNKLLDPLPNEVRPFVAEVIDLVLGVMFDPNLASSQRWDLLAQDAVSLIVRLALEKIAGSRMDAASLEKLRTCLDARVADVVAGKGLDIDKFDACLTQAFAA